MRSATLKLLLLTVTLCGTALRAELIEVYSNLETYNGYSNAHNGGVGAAFGNYPSEYPSSLADFIPFFVPSGRNYTLDSLELFISWISGANDLDVWLVGNTFDQHGEIHPAFADVFGIWGQDTGGILEQFSVSNVPARSAETPIGGGRYDSQPVVLQSVTKPLLVGGEWYWILAAAPGSEPEVLNWDQNTIQDNGRFDLINQTNPPDYSFEHGGARGAFRVIGDDPASVPEPEAGGCSFQLWRPFTSGGRKNPPAPPPDYNPGS
jgi:hypothetical protein